ncbi:MAG: D-tyrosyl-tRNA(Tyr) deacylase [Proteobacteria bacterium]|nr:MAG: D-tyrosyl-tRNA(Tyr) deacylase [Pseudomonadota bacterium]
MKGLIQRVSSASVVIEGSTVGEIGQGLLLFLGIERMDTEELAHKMLRKVLSYRVFADDQGKMNRSLSDAGGGLLVVSQFTLVANTAKGSRPGFSSGASPELGERLYDCFLRQARLVHPVVGSGIFGADMQVSLTNDGPVTFLLEV